jgi:hypothetical protein
MKETEMHKLIKDLKLDVHYRPYHKAQLKQAVLYTDLSKHSFTSRFLGSFKILSRVKRGIIIMKSKKLITSASFALVAVLMASVIVLAQTSNSPKVMAQELTDKGISSLRQLDIDKFEKLRSQFAGDPLAALEEAKTAKDLKTISKDEYNRLKKNASVVVTTNKTEQIPGGGSISSDSITTKDASGNPVTTGSVSVSTGPTTTPPEGAEVQQSQIQEAQPISGELLPEIGEGAVTMVGFNDEDIATKYIMYTNNGGNIVVIGFDSNSSPVFKTVLKK